MVALDFLESDRDVVRSMTRSPPGFGAPARGRVEARSTFEARRGSRCQVHRCPPGGGCRGGTICAWSCAMDLTARATSGSAREVGSRWRLSAWGRAMHAGACAVSPGVFPGPGVNRFAIGASSTVSNGGCAAEGFGSRVAHCLGVMPGKAAGKIDSFGELLEQSLVSPQQPNHAVVSPCTFILADAGTRSH